MKEWSNLGKIVFRRTYARKDSGKIENLREAAERVIAGNVRGHKVSESEQKALLKLMMENKAGPAGRGWWFSGAPSHERVGGAALNNCWYFNAANWENYPKACDLLMLGGGVGLSVEHQFVDQLPKVHRVSIKHELSETADFVVPDSREGWCELLYRVLEAYFVTGRSFSYSTIKVRKAGEPIKGFGGTSSGPGPLILLLEDIEKILSPRAGTKIRSVDAADLICAIAKMVVAGNVRRSAIIIIGDCRDEEYLKAKRWDLGYVPPYRANANFSVVCDDIDEVHPLFWKTYDEGEPFGIVNRKNIQKYGRMGELRPDTAEGVNPCAEATLENGEGCNLVEQAINNMESVQEFLESSRLMLRYAKRVSMENYHIADTQRVISKNRRIGIGITGCLAAPQYFNPEILDRAYGAIQREDHRYSHELGIPESIRTTVIKPSGTRSKAMDCHGFEGVHVPLSQHMIQRIRFAPDDQLLPVLAAAGHVVQPDVDLNGNPDYTKTVVDFYVKAPEGLPTVADGWTTWKQLDTILMAQKHWADQSVSCTVYYRKEEIPQLRQWLRENLQYLKTISFLLESGHGFKLAPKEAITGEQYDELSSKVKPIDIDAIGDGEMLEGTECDGGACPIK